MEFTVGSRAIEIKFDYMTMYKVNRDLGSQGPDGSRNEDGVGALFLRVVDRNDSALVDLIKLCASKKAKAEEAIKAIADKMEELGAESTEPLFEALEEEMVESGFFKEKISKYLENLELGLKYLKAKAETAEDKAQAELQIEQTEAQIGRLRSAIS